MYSEWRELIAHLRQYNKTEICVRTQIERRVRCLYCSRIDNQYDHGCTVYYYWLCMSFGRKKYAPHQRTQVDESYNPAARVPSDSCAIFCCATVPRWLSLVCFSPIIVQPMPSVQTLLFFLLNRSIPSFFFFGVVFVFRYVGSVYVVYRWRLEQPFHLRRMPRARRVRLMLSSLTVGLPRNPGPPSAGPTVRSTQPTVGSTHHPLNPTHRPLDPPSHHPLDPYSHHPLPAIPSSIRPIFPPSSTLISSSTRPIIPSSIIPSSIRPIIPPSSTLIS